jgi:hypothetical protein
MYILAVPGHALLWLTRLNGKERKEKAHISNMFNFTMPVGIGVSIVESDNLGTNSENG